MKAHKTSFINLMKILGALVNPKGITNHSYKSNIVLKVSWFVTMNLYGGGREIERTMVT
jgi:hypothetical protein